ncbi:RNA exonuclease 5-like [Babylonia areolata]|uniref:RNA exonuclease 5-like n=1 Tax=Babylonia areolata TaxID=304850 RepID=UPI003FD40867
MAKRKAVVATGTGGKKQCKEKDGQSPTSEADGAGGKGKNIEKYMQIKRKQAASMQRPKVYLTMENLSVGIKLSEQAAGEQSAKEAPQLFVRDLQYLLLYALRRGLNYDHPRWCRLLRPGKMSSTVLIVLSEVSMEDFQLHSDCFPFLQGTFSEKLRVTMTNPCRYFSTFNFDMYAVPMSQSQLRGFQRKHGSTSHRNGIEVVFPKSSRAPDNGETPPADTADKSMDKEEEDGKTVCRTQLLMSVEQMIEENYPVPGEEDSDEKYKDYVVSKEHYTPVAPNSPLFAVDCEMCLTSAMRHELARVSIVNDQNEVIYDELVKPYNPIINYLTRYSGITKRILDPVTKRIEEVQREISELLPDDAILCGQSLGNDLTALKMFHPYVIDTSLIYNLSGSRRMKCSLKRLSFCFLGRVIQGSKSGHSSAEDAEATLDLVKLKLRKTLSFGDAVLGGDVTPSLPSHQLPSDSTGPGQSQSSAAGVSPADVGSKGGISGSTRRKPQVLSQPEAVMMRSLFDILNDIGVSACQVGGERLVSKHKEEPGLQCCQTTSDEESRRKAAEAGRDCTFTWVEFSSFADLLATQDSEAPQPDQTAEEAGEESSETAVATAADVKQRKKVLRTLDKHVRKLTEKLPEKCLITVVMTGRSSQSHQQAAAFLHIT